MFESFKAEAAEMEQQVNAEREAADLAADICMSACEKGQQGAAALQLLKEMSSQSVALDVITYSTCMSACEKGQQWAAALQLLEEMSWLSS